MHVLVATDGHLDSSLAVEPAMRLAGTDGSVTVMTVVEVNRAMIRQLRELYGERQPPRSDQDAEYVGLMPTGSGVGKGWPGDDEMLDRYMADQGAQRLGPLSEAFAAAGIEVTTVVREGEEAASTILEEARRRDVDVIVVGSTGKGVIEQFMLGSTSQKLVRRSPVPVLVLRR